jgi:hypothetical protein
MFLKCLHQKYLYWSHLYHIHISIFYRINIINEKLIYITLNLICYIDLTISGPPSKYPEI